MLQNRNCNLLLQPHGPGATTSIHLDAAPTAALQFTCRLVGTRRLLKSNHCVGARVAGQSPTREDRKNKQQRDLQPLSQFSEANSPCAHLEASNTRAAIKIFGVCHLEAEIEAAEWIWQHSPAVVVVETAINDSHGIETGAAVSMASVQLAGSDFRLRMLMQIAGQLSADVGQSSSASQLWQTLKPQFPGEQLAYIAALAVGAQLVFGDRPKAITYQRLHNLSSLADLDVAFGRISAQNYAEMLPLGPNGGLPRASGHNDCVWAIMTEERDAVLAASLRRAAEEVGPCGAVAGVVGLDHLPGVKRWLHVGPRGDEETLQEAGSPPAEGAHDAGVRRALLRSCLALCCSPEVVEDCDAVLHQVLGLLPPSGELAEQTAVEIYGSTRMLLAALTHEQLRAVCSGWRCDMHALLQPVRAARPCNGGGGAVEDILWDHVRDLNLVLSMEDPDPAPAELEGA